MSNLLKQGNSICSLSLCVLEVHDVRFQTLPSMCVILFTNEWHIACTSFDYMPQQITHSHVVKIYKTTIWRSSNKTSSLLHQRDDAKHTCNACVFFWLQ